MVHSLRLSYCDVSRWLSLWFYSRLASGPAEWNTTVYATSHLPLLPPKHTQRVTTRFKTTAGLLAAYFQNIAGYILRRLF